MENAANFAVIKGTYVGRSRITLTFAVGSKQINIQK